MHCFILSGTRSGESVGGSLVGTVPNGSISTSTSGTCTWAGAAVETLGERPRHFLPSLLENEPCTLSSNITGSNTEKTEMSSKITGLDATLECHNVVKWKCNRDSS